MLTCDWLTLNLRHEGQPDFLHEAPLALSCGFFFFLLQNLLDTYLTYIILYLIEINFNLLKITGTQKTWF